MLLLPLTIRIASKPLFNYFCICLNVVNALYFTIITSLPLKAMKWLARVVSSSPAKTKKPKTPMPPKPYTDELHTRSKQLMDPRYGSGDVLKDTYKDTPHWQDPRYDSKADNKWYDIFGYNRDWSTTLMRVSAIGIFAGLIFEAHLLMNFNSDLTDVQTALNANPDFSPEERRATNDELKEAGFAVVGRGDLSNQFSSRR